jgi:hypothetical protein
MAAHRVSDWRALAFITIAAALATIPVWIPAFPPMTDLPQHASQIALLRNMSAADFPFHDDFTVTWFTPYLVGYMLVYAIVPLIGIVAACKAVIAGAVIALPLTTALLLIESEGEPRWALLTIPASYSFAYQGFSQFLDRRPDRVDVPVAGLAPDVGGQRVGCAWDCRGDQLAVLLSCDGLRVLRRDCRSDCLGEKCDVTRCHPATLAPGISRTVDGRVGIEDACAPNRPGSRSVTAAGSRLVSHGGWLLRSPCGSTTPGGVNGAASLASFHDFWACGQAGCLCASGSSS